MHFSAYMYMLSFLNSACSSSRITAGRNLGFKRRVEHGVSNPIPQNDHTKKHANQKNHLNSALRIEKSSFIRVVTYHGENRDSSEITRPTLLLTTRTTIHIGAQSVRIKQESERTSEIATEMKYNLTVLGISETHRTQAGNKRLDLGELLLYSGHEEENVSHTQDAV